MSTLADLYAEYQALLFDGLALNSRAAYQRAWALRVAPTLGDREITTITPLDIMAAAAEWSGSRSTRQDALALVSKLCNLGVLSGQIPHNPVRSMPPRRTPQVTDVASRALSDAEAVHMLALTAHHPHAHRILAALLYTGCRLGEVMGLERGDIDGNVLRIRRSLSPQNGVMTVGPTKGRQARAVPIIPAMREVLTEALDNPAHESRLFTGAKGGPMSSSNLTRAVNWHHIRDQIKTFPADQPALRFHDLRHTAAVNFFRVGLSAPDVQRILGHSSLQVTEQYARSTDAAALRAVAAFSAELTPGVSA
ncbi:tyrosine-type recombinase/integrase [Gulosibacter hominis]|uniref:tyrosine-type recombinase/integrase n=1 Tax=Gulosibacter hominis TaxID=2770504 RepID=UPI00191A6A81|nr:site-specific integrase [Gulosibacter hominis]